MPKGDELEIVVGDEAGMENEFPESDVIIDVLEEGSDKESNPELEALKAELEKERADKANLSAQATQNELLAQTLKNINDNLKVKPDDKDEDEDFKSSLDLKAIIENVDKNLVLKPGETLMQALSPIVQELEQGYSRQLSKRDKELGKLSIYQNEEDRKIYSSYQEEVDTLAKKYTGTDAYSKAVKEVRLNHSEEILAARMETMKAELLAELQKGQDAEKPAGSTTPTFTNAQQNLNSGKRTIKISPKDLQLVKDWAFSTGGFFDLSDPKKLEIAIDTAKQVGVIR